MGTEKPILIGLARYELHVPDARSLKEKRAEIRRLVDRIRARHQVLVIEAGHQDLLQRAILAVSALSTSGRDLEQRLQRVDNTIDELFAGFITGRSSDIFEA